MADMNHNARCRKCQRTFTEVFCLALAISLGARTNDPNRCGGVDGEEHDWTDVVRQPVTPRKG